MKVSDCEVIFIKWNNIPHVDFPVGYGDCVYPLTAEDLKVIYDELLKRTENNGPWDKEE